MTFSRRLMPVLAGLSILSSACGGGGNSSGLLVEGNLVEARGVAHAKHSAGSPIEEVEICALSECAITDLEGRWGFVLDSHPDEIVLTINGHGIDTSTPVAIPADAEDVFLGLKHVDGGLVVADEMIVNGVSIHSSGDSHDH